ncbi:translation initiation factor [Leptolyngbya sp. PCC 6406]|uniref:translation initiation factor n=1 Tax=Leptolyngbya sp. PCC 6406 TaxID=1173264 RepID=UPI0002ACC665|nr:translation initiation factor [Leptolyngbya sp. PCC 6406]
MAKRKGASAQGTDAPRDRVVYSEFSTARPAALQRGVQDLPPAQQSLKVEVSRKGRGGKTVTIVSGFQHRPETLATLLKKLKAQCGSGGTVKEATVEIQGDHAQTLLTVLQKQGYSVKRSGG